MSVFSLKESQKRAEVRLGGGKPPGRRRRRRSDAGAFRLDSGVAARLDALLGGQERPRVADVLRRLQAWCEGAERRCPSRATVYAYMDRGPGHTYRIEALPPAVARALYNLDDHGRVPGRQVVFMSLNYGEMRAVHHAAGMPWLDLWQARRLRGWRPRSRGLLDAAMATRGI